MNEQMKQYTGTKTVKAMPMTMGEAYERKLLKNGVRPSECETDKAGYFVEYEGGYQSWSPADVFEKAYKPSETFADRIVLEFKDLEKRMCKCDNFLYSDEFSALDTLSRALLTVQRGLMGQYYFVLADYIRLTAHIAVLKEIAVDYSGKTIDNIIQQLEAIKKEVEND